MKWREKAADAGGIPEDVLMGWPRLVWYGHHRLIVEQHRGILMYQENAIRLRTSCGILYVEGAGLEISHYGPMDAVVIGQIARVGYESLEREGKRP